MFFIASHSKARHLKRRCPVPSYVFGVKCVGWQEIDIRIARP